MLYKPSPLHSLSHIPIPIPIPEKQPSQQRNSSTMSYQQRRVEYEVREYNNAASGFTYGANNAAYGYANNNAASAFSSGGAAFGGGATYGTTGYSGGGAGGYSSGGGYGATGYESGSYGGSAASGGFNMSSGGGQAQLYKNEVQAMPAKIGMCGPEMFQGGGGGCGIGGDPFCALVPSSFPPGTDPKFIDCFNRIDKDRSGLICDQELQVALSNFDQKFSLRTVHLLMYMFTGSNSKVVGPKEFVPLVRSLQTWKGTFQKYDCDRNGRLDERELRDALMSMGFMVSPFVLKLLVSKYDKSGYKCGIEYDFFIECCVIVKGLTEKFRAKEDSHACGTATFTYDEFLLNVLPFIVA